MAPRFTNLKVDPSRWPTSTQLAWRKAIPGFTPAMMVLILRLPSSSAKVVVVLALPK